MPTFDVEIEFSTWRSRLWIRLMRLIAPIVGYDVAYRWGTRGALRLARWRAKDGKFFGRRWRRVSP